VLEEEGGTALPGRAADDGGLAQLGLPQQRACTYGELGERGEDGAYEVVRPVFRSCGTSWRPACARGFAVRRASVRGRAGLWPGRVRAPRHGKRLRGVRRPLGLCGPPRSCPGDRTPERRAGATWIDHVRLERACATLTRLAVTSPDPAFSFVYPVSKMLNSKKCQLS
jgi:hypothetical protein